MLKEEKRRRILLFFGLCLVLASAFGLALVAYPIVKSEIKFYLNRDSAGGAVVSLDLGPEDKSSSFIVVRDKEFGLVIPKLGINVSVIPNVDPKNSKEYQKALTKGVAHAKGTSTPDNLGNTFLFAHSSDTFFNVNMYNAIFYLLNKMETNDTFYIAYKNTLYKYLVVEKKVILPNETNYYTSPLPNFEKTAILMTCWPPATTLKRLVVVGVQVE